MKKMLQTRASMHRSIEKQGGYLSLAGRKGESKSPPSISLDEIAGLMSQCEHSTPDEELCAQASTRTSVCKASTFEGEPFRTLLICGSFVPQPSEG